MPVAELGSLAGSVFLPFGSQFPTVGCRRHRHSLNVYDRGFGPVYFHRGLLHDVRDDPFLVGGVPRFRVEVHGVV